MKILGVDWGMQNLGLAVSESGLLGRELPEMKTSVDNLAQFIINQKVTQVVVGLPTTPDGGEGLQAAAVRSFGEQLAARINLPIVYEDEAFTTDEAQNLGGSHSLAARLILEQYLHHAKKDSIGN